MFQHCFSCFVNAAISLLLTVLSLPSSCATFGLASGAKFFKSDENSSLSSFGFGAFGFDFGLGAAFGFGGGFGLADGGAGMGCALGVFGFGLEVDFGGVGIGRCFAGFSFGFCGETISTLITIGGGGFGAKNGRPVIKSNIAMLCTRADPKSGAPNFCSVLAVFGMMKLA